MTVLTETVPSPDPAAAVAVARAILNQHDPDYYGGSLWPVNPDIANPPPPIDCRVLDAGMGR